jgi:chromosomal replication initiation ATPase DnaA
MHDKTGVVPIAPATLARAFADQRSTVPDDADALDRLFQQIEETRPSMSEIKTCICDYYAIDPLELRGRYRAYETAQARQVFCFLAYKYTGFSLRQIGHYVGLQNHTTVHHAVRKIEKLSITKQRIADDLDLLRLRISEKILIRRRGFAC